MADGQSIIDNIVFTGRMSTFGGPNDSGVAPDEGLELINPAQVGQFPGLFLADQPQGTTGLAKRLNTDAYYVACRWDFAKTPKEKLRAIKVLVSNPKTGKSIEAQPVDWGPDPATGRVADLSDGLAKDLELQTDQICSVVVPASAFAAVTTSDASGQTTLGTWQVLAEEASEIDGNKITAHIGNFPALNQELNQRNHAALCLSGGGIRSGSFALGLMQSLAGSPKPGVGSYLGQFSFLSTVSGGGYIGGWFSAWLTRSRNARNKIMAGDVLASLADQSATKDEAPAIENLRVNSNYLTPKVGALSADSWADLAMYLRNLILNWLVMVPVFVILVLLAKATSLLPAYSGLVPFYGVWTGALILLALFLTITFLSYQIGGRPTQGISNRDQKWFLTCDLLPAVFASLFLSCILGRQHVGIAILDLLGPTLGEPVISHYYVAAGLIGGTVYCISWFLAKIWSRTSNSMEAGLGKVDQPSARTLLDMFWWTMAGLLFGVFIVAGLSLLSMLPTTAIFGADIDIRTLVLVIAGPPWILLSHLVAEMIFVGVTSYEPSSDDDREWLARSAGWYGVIVVGWSVFFALLLVGTYLSTGFFSKILAHWLAPIGGMSGAISLLLGKMPWTAAKSTDRRKTTKEWSLDTILGVTVPLFGATLVVAASAIIDRLLFGGPYWPTGPANWTKLLTALSVATAMAVIASYFININRFSLHALYRNRLIRAFLGASRAPDRPLRNLFTDFDDADNPPMHQLWQRGVEPKADNWRPFHVINMALNVVSSQNLAWQERKAEPFIVSPLHSGSGSKTFDGPGAYQRTEQYGDRFGISLGTAIAISGAAASPQMGYQSSPALAFLMSLFNVRLGWWLANPGHAGLGHYRDEGPGFALKPLASEMFGLTTDTRTYVYLSDGGHFENLGLYEMIRRRCRYIVVSDAGCDPKFTFEDLGNAFRKIKIDLRVDIEFFHRERLRFRPKKDTAGQKDFAGQTYFCLGIIKYCDADGGASKNGILLYVKPGLRGDEPPDIASYAKANPTFPHESTSDQWFSESQFESYRHLGFCIGQTIVAAANLTDTASPKLADLLRALAKSESDIEEKYGGSL